MDVGAWLPMYTMLCCALNLSSLLLFFLNILSGGLSNLVLLLIYAFFGKFYIGSGGVCNIISSKVSVVA